MNWDTLLQSASNTAGQVIDAWGKVQVASLNAQVQPPAPVRGNPLGGIGATASGMSTTTMILLGIAAVGVFMVIRK